MTDKQSNLDKAREIVASRGEILLVSPEDYEALSEKKWSINGAGYANANAKDGSGKTVFMHRLVMNAPSGKEVHHINHNKLDNRRSNLVLCTTSQNHASKRMSPRNTSGYRGVWWSKPRNKWVAQIRAHKHTRHLGHFDDPKDAARAYDKAVTDAWGEFAWTNEGHGLI